MVKNQIFVGMPSLLSNEQQNSFKADWPLCKDLPPLISKSLFNPLLQEQFNLSCLIKHCIENCKQEKSQQLSSFKLRKVKSITNCPHKNKKHYAKGLCSNCYSKMLRVSKIPTCGHPEKEVFSRNMCLQCYTKAYREFRKNN